MTDTPRLDLRGLTGAQGKTGRDRPIATGLAADRPAADLITPDSFYYATDTSEVSYSDGATWTEVSPSDPAPVELDYTLKTSDAATSATSAATASTAFSSASVSVTGEIEIEVMIPRLIHSAAGGGAVANLWEDSTDLGSIAWVVAISANDGATPGVVRVRRTPSVASHTYHVKCWGSAGTTTLKAGTPFVNAYIKIATVP